MTLLEKNRPIAFLNSVILKGISCTQKELTRCGAAILAGLQLQQRQELWRYSNGFTKNSKANQSLSKKAALVHQERQVQNQDYG